MEFNEIELGLQKGWCLIKTHNLSLNLFHKLIHNFKCEQGIVRYKKRGEIYTFSVYDIECFYKQCNKLNIKIHASQILMFYVSVINKKLTLQHNLLKMDLWSDDPSKQLYSYQKKCISKALSSRNLIIADTLGLGKTNECIGTICESISQYGFNKHIVILPAKLRVQWSEEIRRFTKLDKNYFTVFDDPRIKKKKTKELVEKHRIETIKNANILLISYNMVKKYVHYLIKQKYQLLVLDEATKIKNTTDTTSNVKKICLSMPNNSIKLFVTGTPIENKLEDLYNVFTIIDKRIFGYSSEFKFNYTQRDCDDKVVGYKNLDKFKDKIRSFYLRRTSDLVWKDRPKLSEKYEICVMEGKQKQIYTDARRGVLQDLKDLERQSQINNATLAPLMQILLSVSGTCKAIIPDYIGKDHSCKIKVLLDMINDFDKNDKMLIFSRYANLVNPHIRADIEKYTDFIVLEANGNTKNPTEVVKRFSETKSVLLASDSLSYGANVQAANYLINFDLPWNPAVFSQRVGRAYRRGQKRNVNVINLLAAGSFDMKVYNKLYLKQNLFNKIFTSDLSSFSVENKVEELKEVLYEYARTGRA